MAKAAAVVASTLPPGWVVGWAHPGAWPPGYTPTLSYTLVTGATYAPGNTHLATATLYDQVSYDTGAPDNPMTWKATIDDASIELKEDGDDDWVEVLQTDHSAIGSYGAAPSLRFNVSNANDGATIVLIGNSTPFDGVAAPDEIEAEITVVVSRYATVECQITSSAMTEPDAGTTRQLGFRMTFNETGGGPTDPAGGAWITVWRINSTVEYHASSLSTDASNSDDHYNISASLETQSGFDELYYLTYDFFDTQYSRLPRKALIKALDLTDADDWTITHRFEPHDDLEGASTTYDFTFKLYENSILTETKTKQVVVADGAGLSSTVTWLTIAANGTITEVNP